MINFEKEYLKYKNEIIDETMKLINIPSVLNENEEFEGKVYKFGYNNKLALDYFLSLASKMGFKTKNIENVCGHVEYGEGEEIFACLCHLDVVPADGDWNNPPFESWIEDGKIFGRGSSDDKGPAVASLYALKVLKDLNVKLKRRVRLIVGTDEETYSRGLKRYLEVEEKPTLGISPDADFPIIYGEKGIASLMIKSKNESGIRAVGGVRYNVVAPWTKVKKTIDTKYLEDLSNVTCDNDEYYIEGKSAHAMEPDNGINAIKDSVKASYKKVNSKFIDFIYENLMNTRLKSMGLDVRSEEMGDLTMNIGLLKMDENCELGINIRYPNVLDFDNFVNSFKEKAAQYGQEVVVVSNTNPHYVNPNSDFIKTLHASYIKYTNDNSPLKTIGGGTYARDIPNGVAFGVKFPNEEEMAHEANEFIRIDSLIKAGIIITDAIYNVNKED